MIDGIAAIASDEAAIRRAKRQNKHRSYDLILPYIPELDGVDLDEIFKLDHPPIKRSKHNRPILKVDVDEF